MLMTMGARALATVLAVGVAGCTLLYGPGSDLASGDESGAPADGSDGTLDADAVDGAPAGDAADAADGGPVLPDIPSGGLIVWLRGDDGVVASAAARVSAWNDSSPKLRPGAKPANAVQNDVAAQPARASGPGGLTTVVFDGHHTLELPFGFADFTAGLSVFVAFELPGPGSGGPVFALGSVGSCGRGAELFLDAKGIDYRVENTDVGVETNLASGAWEVISAVQSARDTAYDAGDGCHRSRVELRRSDLLLVGGLVRVPDVIGRGGTRLGRSNLYPDEYITSAIGEIIVYDRALTAAETTTVSTYLAQKWTR